MSKEILAKLIANIAVEVKERVGYLPSWALNLNTDQFRVIVSYPGGTMEISAIGAGAMLDPSHVFKKFSCRFGNNGEILSFVPHRITLEEATKIVEEAMANQATRHIPPSILSTLNERGIQATQEEFAKVPYYYEQYEPSPYTDEWLMYYWTTAQAVEANIKFDFVIAQRQYLLQRLAEGIEVLPKKGEYPIILKPDFAKVRFKDLVEAKVYCETWASAHKLAELLRK